MRILVANAPTPGHLSPLLPLVRSFVDRGNEVMVGAGTGNRSV
jgi:UDP:flavonoid glycosyltransferase YjiC (YdhE family)